VEALNVRVRYLFNKKLGMFVLLNICNQSKYLHDICAIALFTVINNSALQ
jgi:hypothetical protein